MESEQGSEVKTKVFKSENQALQFFLFLMIYNNEIGTQCSRSILVFLTRKHKLVSRCVLQKLEEIYETCF